MTLSIKNNNIKIGYYLILVVFIFSIMEPGVVIPSIYRIAFLALIFLPVIFNSEDFNFALITFYGISSISFTQILPTSVIYYLIIILPFYILHKKKKDFIYKSIALYGYLFIVSLMNFDLTSTLIWLLISILICDMIKDENDLQKIFLAFIIISLFLSILYLVYREEFLVQYGKVSDNVERSGWINPNVFGAHIAIGGVVSIAYITNYLRMNKSKLLNIICIITAVLSVIVLILNASRGSILAFVVPSVLMLIFSKIKLIYKLLIIVFISLFITWMYTNNVFDLLLVRLESDNVTSGGGRIEIWKLKLDLFWTSNNIFDILLGIGETETIKLGKYISTHNDIVTSMIAYGIIGFILFIYYIFIYPIIKAKKNRTTILILLSYLLIECCVLEPFFRGYLVIVMFYFFILKYIYIYNEKY